MLEIGLACAQHLFECLIITNSTLPLRSSCSDLASRSCSEIEEAVSCFLLGAMSSLELVMFICSCTEAELHQSQLAIHTRGGWTASRAFRDVYSGSS